MKPIKIKHYVEKSYEGKPSAVIEMSDGKDYISNGCVFIENTPENVEYLIEEYDCKEELEELFLSRGIADEGLVNGSYLFRGCNSLTEPGVYPDLKKGSYMYQGCSFNPQTKTQEKSNEKTS